MTAPDDALDTLRAWLLDSRSTVIFTGAGISTESGIPDFRSPGGIWSRYRPIDFGEFMASEEKRRESWRMRFALENEGLFGQAQPNIAHRRIAEWIEQGRADCVITQNIDGLHQAAGVPDMQVIELHGNNQYAGCLECHKRFELAPIRANFMRDESLPWCDRCGGIVKSAVISFGQPMPEAAMRRAQAVSLGCELFIVIGSSLLVYPAADLPVLAKRRGARLVIINREPTPLDGLADLLLPRQIGPTLAGIDLPER